QGDVPSEVSPLVERLNALFSRVRSSLDGERRFTSDAAHELRTPLAALRAQLQVAQGAGDAPGRDRALSQALAAADRATRVVEQLLTLARLEHDAWREAARPFDLRAVAAQALAERAERARAAGVELALEGLVSAEVVGQSGLADIALGNLLDNAIGHSPPDTTVSILLAREGASVVARVRDQGPGIPPARREEALARFTRLDDAAREGSGLGLSIVARIAELHGAPVALADGPGGAGLEATLRFPAG
ncbi:MAG: two-component sensor histidine kinase, partial [Burkholderiales bacterium]|nr:two-component sensor histidine kinase [Burkholderiales bacterium]